MAITDENNQQSQLTERQQKMTRQAEAGKPNHTPVELQHHKKHEGVEV